MVLAGHDHHETDLPDRRRMPTFLIISSRSSNGTDAASIVERRDNCSRAWVSDSTASESSATRFDFLKKHGPNGAVTVLPTTRLRARGVGLDTLLPVCKNTDSVFWPSHKRGPNGSIPVCEKPSPVGKKMYTRGIEPAQSGPKSSR